MCEAHDIPEKNKSERERFFFIIGVVYGQFLAIPIPKTCSPKSLIWLDWVGSARLRHPPHSNTHNKWRLWTYSTSKKSWNKYFFFLELYLRKLSKCKNIVMVVRTSDHTRWVILSLRHWSTISSLYKILEIEFCFPEWA